MRVRHSTAGNRWAAGVLAALLGLIGALLVPEPASAAPAARGTSVIRHGVSVAAAALPTRLRGVNRSGTEFMCVQNRGIFDGPADGASIQAIKNWRADVVRVPLNEDCWLGINGVNPAYSGANYRNAISDYVSRLRQAGLYVILELHWSSGVHIGFGSTCWAYAAQCQKPMPDSDHAPDFWKSVANAFKSDQAVVFDLFNEPFPNLVMFDRNASWKCWRDGGPACIGFLYSVAGMQTLVNAVRSTGATNPVMVGGIDYSNDLSGWLTYAPSDPAGNLMASWHSYNFNSCNTRSCWDSTIAPVAARYPLVVGEIGQNDCAHGYVDTLMNWLDIRELGYLGWTWNTWDCKSGPALITDYDGTPTAYGQGLKNRLASG
ncbi:glycoside hydrolase family 5 protein [Streptomyces scabiei]|uniref:glycoside hydrolase family 5 protein n=1 Tax=Streptomyces scabiei TaxID=1930 RepID=UPI0029A49EAD|nr:cellulase family glycosylhydrolase [Streptomyces scabiei]MDX3112219.1 cellulase family glycosylhydrolase [Streptomyces scabiei]